MRALPPGCRLAVFDLDGTLYEQAPVRRAMAAELLPGLATAKGRARFVALRRFRKLREEMSDDAPRGFDRALFSRVSAETGMTEKALRDLVEEWMGRRPLRHLRRARVPGAGELFAALRDRGVQIAVWSDHAIGGKLDALGLAADHLVSATDPEIDTLKPDPAGLAEALRRADCRAEEALMVGDRMERDGAAAKALGVPFLLRAPKGPSGIPRVADFEGLAEGLAREAA